MKYDTIIVGMGIAGISAAIYLKRANNNCLIIEAEMPGGTLNKIKHIANYPGFKTITGQELAVNLFSQVNELGIPYKIETVKRITKDNDIFEIVTNNTKYSANNIIIASGKVSGSQKITDEDKYVGKGISYCVLCDGDFYKNKIVTITGNGSSVIEEAKELANIASKVYFITTNDINIDVDNIEVINTQITSLIGQETLTKVILENNQELNIDGLFIVNESTSNMDYLSELNIETINNKLVVDNNNQTNVTGLYAAGDIIKKDWYQLVNASYEGANAAINIVKGTK